MDKRKSEIQEHQQEIDELDLSIERQNGELGQRILSRKNCEIEALQELYSSGKELEKNIAESEKQRDAILRNLDRQREIEDELSEIEKEDKMYQASWQDLVGSLGAHAYRVYRSGTLDKGEFRSIFSGIDEIVADIQEKEQQVQDLEEKLAAKNFFQKVPITAKISVLRNSISRLEKKRDSELPVIGEALLESEKIENVPDEQARSVTSNLKQQEEGRQERIERIEELTKDREKLNDELAGMTGDSNADKRLKQLDEEIAEYRDQLFEHTKNIGKAYLLQPSSEKEVPKETAEILQRIEELQERKRNHERRVQNLQSQLEIEELQEGMKKKEEQIARLEKRIGEEKDMVQEIKDELHADNNRVQDLRKIVQVESEAVAQTSQKKAKAAKKEKAENTEVEKEAEGE